MMKYDDVDDKAFNYIFSLTNVLYKYDFSEIDIIMSIFYLLIVVTICIEVRSICID